MPQWSCAASVAAHRRDVRRSLCGDADESCPARRRRPALVERAPPAKRGSRGLRGRCPVASGIDECGSVAVSVHSRPGRRSTAGSRSATPSHRAGSLPTTRRSGSTSPRAWSAWTWRRPPSRDSPPELDGVRLRHHRRRFRLADGLTRATTSSRIDPVTGKVVTSIPVGSAPAGVAVTAGSVWVADEHSEAVTRIDPATNKCRRDDPGRPAATGRATDHDGWTRWRLGGRPQHG